MHSFLDNTLAFLGSQSLQIVIVVLLVYIGSRAVRSSSAHWRYLLWLVVIAKCLTPPIVIIPLAVFSENEPERLTSIIELESFSTNQSLESSSVLSVEQTAAEAALYGPKKTLESNPRIALPVTKGMDLSQWTVIIWLLGVFTILAAIAAKVWATHRKIVRERSLAGVEIQQLVTELSRLLGMKRLPNVYHVDFTPQPFVWGALWGDIYLPTNFVHVGTHEQRIAMLTHELAHVLRFDAGVNHVQNIVQAIFFFHPLIWFANQRIRLEREKCCDEIVLSYACNSPITYCEAIVDMLARQHASPMVTPVLAVTGARKNIQDRIVSMLKPNRKFFRSPSRIAVSAVCLFTACILPTFLVLTSRNGYTQGPQNEDVKLETKRFRWQLVDETGKPVQGVRVTPCAMKFKEDPSVAVSWYNGTNGIKDYVTDEKGEVEVEYPNGVSGPVEFLTTSALIIRYKHSDFVAGEATAYLTLENTPQRLTRGCAVNLRCLDIGGKPINDFAAIMAGYANEATWTLSNSGMRSNGVPEGKWQSMLVVPSVDGRHLFSDPFDVICEVDRETSLEVKVQPGMRLTGSIASDVPRPIENGKVIAWCVPKPLGPSIGDTPAVTWLQETAISSEGTFEFPSLPTSQSVQLIAISNGWMLDGWANGMMQGIIVKPDQKQQNEREISGIVLQMKRAGSVEVEVLDVDGESVEGAQVSSWPNQAYSHGGGSTLLGYCYNSIDLATAQMKGVSPPVADLSQEDRYNATTDKNGRAVLRDLPLNEDLTLNVFHKDWSIKADKSKSKLFSGIKYRCDPNAPKSLTVQMYNPRVDRSINPQNANKLNEAGKSTKKTTMGAEGQQISSFGVELLKTDDLQSAFKKHLVVLNPPLRKILLDDARELVKTRPSIGRVIQQLDDGTSKLTLDALAELLMDRVDGTAIFTELTKHEDVVVRFMATLLLAIRGDDASVRSIHQLIHDRSISLTSRQLIVTWSSGVGIRATDSPEQIADHFLNVSRDEPKFKAGDHAPTFRFETITGDKVSSDDLRGKVVVLHFWATSCGGCLSRMPSHIESISKLDQSKLEVIFVSLDDDREKFDQAIAKYQIPFKNVLDQQGWGGQLARTFGVKSMPFDIIIDADGRIISNSIDDLATALKATP